MSRGWGLVVACVLLAGCGDPGDDMQASPAGEQTYTRFCFSCHAAGIAGAPRTGDRDAWASRVAKGRDVLLQATIEGVPPGMPPKGLCAQCSDEELAAAIDYMIEHSL